MAVVVKGHPTHTESATTSATSLWTGAEASLLRWGGVAGLLGSAIFLFVFAFVGAVVGPDPAGIAGPITRFPDVRTGRTIENTLYLAALVLWMVDILALNWAVRSNGQPSTRVGTVLGVVALGVLAAGALPHTATVALADHYHAAGVSAAQQATLASAWLATQGIFNALLVTGLVLAPISMVALGLSMRAVPAFGSRAGWACVLLGVMAAGTGIVLLVDPLSFMAVLGFVALIAFHLIVGWKLVRLSSAARG